MGLVTALPERNKLTRLITDGDRCYVIAFLPERTATLAAQGINAGDITDKSLADAIENAVALHTMPGRIRRSSL